MEIEPILKKCSKCQVEKFLTEFCKNKGRKDGLSYYCKGCDKQRVKLYNYIHKPERDKYGKDYYQKNKSTITKKNENYIRKKYKTNPYFRLVLNLRRRTLLALKSNKKFATTLKLLGCSKEDLIKHLESKFQSGMSWGNHSQNGWHVDHIRPCSSFDLSDPIQQRQCFHFSNLQPLWAKDNLSKGSKYIKNSSITV